MYQKITIVGNLGRDPEMRYMADGTAVTSFSVATTRTWSSKGGEKQEETLWFRVNVWGRQAETTNQYLAKGRRVLVEGSLQGDAATGGPRLWSRQDGSMAASFEIRANEVKFLSSRNENTGGGGGYTPPGYDGDGGAVAGGSAAEEDDIPF
ncbi:MAG: single-stranded DNA-binding protein [Anaerolineae bacterium]